MQSVLRGALFLGILFEILTAQLCNYDSVEPGCEVDRDVCRQSPSFAFEISGITSDRTSPCQYRYLMSLQEKLPEMEDCFYHLCGGVLIAADLVLTATHCIYGLINSSQISGELDNLLYVARAPKCRHHKGEARSRITHYWLYPHFQTTTFLNDIAILKISQQFDPPYLSYNVPNNIQGDDQLSIIGWGDIDKFESIERFPYNVKQVRIGDNMKMLSSLECQNTLNQLGEQINVIHPQMICAQGQFLDSCRGDSGGPLILTQGGREMIVGIISQGVGKSQCITSQNVTKPGIFTNVSFYSEWIDSVVELLKLMQLQQTMAEQMQRTFTIEEQQSNFIIPLDSSKQVDTVQLGAVQLSPLSLPAVNTQNIYQDGIQLNFTIQVIDRSTDVLCNQNNSPTTSNFGGNGIFANLLFPKDKCIGRGQNINA